MTVAEVGRYEEGAIWRLKQQAQFDYALANIIGISSARMISKDVVFPPIEEVYPYLFEKTEEEKKKERQEEIATKNAVNQFMQFALKHNRMMRREGDNK